MYLILTDVEVAAKLFESLKNNKEQIDMIGLSKIIDPYILYMAYFEQIELEPLQPTSSILSGALTAAA